MPEPSETDDAIMDLWEGLRASVSQGTTMEVIGMWCESHGLSRGARLEVWRRVCLVDHVVLGFHEAMRARTSNAS